MFSLNPAESNIVFFFECLRGIIMLHLCPPHPMPTPTPTRFQKIFPPPSLFYPLLRLIDTLERCYQQISFLTKTERPTDARTDAKILGAHT